jgi:hypothetical protein
MTDRADLRGTGDSAKLPYSRPALTDVGSVADITWGSGPGTDFSDGPNYGGATPAS